MKPFLTWLFSLFNVGLYMQSDVKNLVEQLHRLEITEQANKIAYLYGQLQLLAVIKLLLMIFSMILLFLINLDNVIYAVGWVSKQTTRLYQWSKAKFKKLTKILKP